MSPEKQRIAIAKACGWSWRQHLGYPDCDQLFDPKGVSYGGGAKRSSPAYERAKASIESYNLPDYLHDLNGMHEALKVLKTDEQHRRFVDELNNLNHGGNGAIRFHGRWACASATAAQRAEAFLRTLNLWEPS